MEHHLHGIATLFMGLTESAAIIIIFYGAVRAFVLFVIHALRRRTEDDFISVRLDLGRFLVLGLEFQLAADLLRTAVAPSFEEIGKLAAVATIRTILNYFLNHEIQQERKEMSVAKARVPADP